MPFSRWPGNRPTCAPCFLNGSLNQSKKNYWPVAYILGQLPSPNDTVIRVLLDALDHQEPDIRWAVALLLVRLAKNDDNHIGHLIELSANGTANQKRMALYCIRDLTLNDDASLAALLKGLRDDNPTVRVAAAICLKQRADLNDNDKKSFAENLLGGCGLSGPQCCSDRPGRLGIAVRGICQSLYARPAKATIARAEKPPAPRSSC